MQIDSADQVTVPDQTSLFQTTFDSLSLAFKQWHRTVPNKDARFMTRNDFQLKVNDRVDVDVTWAQRRNGEGYWTGHLSVIPGRLLVEKLRVGYHPTPIFGVHIGSLEYYDQHNDLMFYGDNGRIYYCPGEFGCSDDYEQGWSIVTVHGGFTMDHFGAQNILDPENIVTSIV